MSRKSNRLKRRLVIAEQQAASHARSVGHWVERLADANREYAKLLKSKINIDLSEAFDRRAVECRVRVRDKDWPQAIGINQALDIVAIEMARQKRSVVQMFGEEIADRVLSFIEEKGLKI